MYVYLFSVDVDRNIFGPKCITYDCVNTLVEFEIKRNLEMTMYRKTGYNDVD